MKKINFENLPSTKTPINATNLNLLQSNIEEVFDGKSSMGTISVDDIECKNLFTGWIIGKGIDNTTGAITTNANAGSTDYIPVDFNKNNDYILSRLSTNFRTFVAAYNLNKEFLGRTGANFVDSISLKSTSFPNGTPQGTGDIAYIKIVAYNPTEGDIKQVKDVKPQLEKGSVATKYTPYKCFETSTILFESTSGIGTSGTYDLIDDVSEYKYLEVYVGRGSDYGGNSVKFMRNRNACKVPLYYVTSSGRLYLKLFHITFSGSTFTLNKINHFEFDVTNGITSSEETDGKSCVYLILGYK